MGIGSRLTSHRCDIAVIGGGLSGLSAALAAQRAGAEVMVFERAPAAGGVIASQIVDGHLIERGPWSMVPSEAINSVVQSLKLESALLPISPMARHRFVVRDRRLHRVPMSPPSLMVSPLLSTRGKLRAACELFVPARRSDDDEESLGALVRRRFGTEVLEFLIDPFVSGVYAGDPERLSAAHALPMLRRFEEQHGSILRGALRSARSRRARGGRVQGPLVSFRNGMQQLPVAMARELGEAVRLRATVRGVRRSGTEWLCDIEVGGEVHEVIAASVVFAVPAHALPAIELPAAVRRRLTRVEAVPYAAITSMAIGFPRDAVKHALDGFGMLVPRSEQAPLLGTIFASSLFAGRSGNTDVLLNCFLGGARAAAPSDSSASIENATNYLRELLGIDCAPTFRHVTHWPLGIPQYQLGHAAVLMAAREVEGHFPGLILAGSYLGGVAVGDCIAAGTAAGIRAIAAARSAFATAF